MKTPILAIILVAVTAVGASAQCPSIRLTAPSDDVVAGDAITFVANISGARMVDPKYNWTISAGKIASGQGTPVIRVDSTGLDGQAVTATVEALGFARECPMSASSTAFVRAVVVIAAQKYDEFGKINQEDEMARLDNFTIGLQNDPGSTGYIIIYGGRKSKKTYAATTIKRMRTYLVRQRGVDTNRIVTLNGGLREDPSGEIWLVPQGAPPPNPSPTVESKPVVKTPIKKPTKKKS